MVSGGVCSGAIKPGARLALGQRGDCAVRAHPLAELASEVGACPASGCRPDSMDMDKLHLAGARLPM